MTPLLRFALDFFATLIVGSLVLFVGLYIVDRIARYRQRRYLRKPNYDIAKLLAEYKREETARAELD